MDMKVNTDLIKQLRQAKAWSQDELAVAASLSVRTVQRVETYGTASLETKKALAAAFAIEVTMLDDRRAIELATEAESAHQRRKGWIGAGVGGTCASIAIFYGLLHGTLSAKEAGLYSAIIATGIGLSGVAIGLISRKGIASDSE